MKNFPRKRKQTSITSGYASEIPVSELDDGKRFPVQQSTNPQLKDSDFSQKEKRSVFSQTDFSSDEEVAGEKKLPISAVFSKTVKDDLPKMVVDNFCWRHDNVYDKIIFPPARPTSASSNDGKLQVWPDPGEMTHPKP